MHKIIRGLLIAAVACLVGGSSPAEACDVAGRVVCTGNGTGVAGVVVSLRADSATAWYATTDANGAFATHVGWADTVYAVSLDLSAAGVTGDAALVSQLPTTCDLYGSPITLPTYEVDVPGCTPPDVTADCSSGFYKNHPEAWCEPCGYSAAQCTYLVGELSTKGLAGSGVIRRDAAKAELDACFGTAEASPCEDDD